MSEEELDRRAIERYLAEGCPNVYRAEAEDEQERLQKRALYDWWKKVLDDEDSLHLAIDLASGALTAAEWARLTGRHRSSALREKQKLFTLLGMRILNDASLQASMPSPWKQWYFDRP